MLSEGQWQALENWLLQVKDSHSVKFIITSCALLFQMWIDIPRDRWNGFPSERKRLLKFLAEHEIEGVHLLAGDLHSSHAVRAGLRSPTGRPIRLWEFCASPFEQRPNWMGRYTYFPILTRWLKNQKLFLSARNSILGWFEWFLGSINPLKFVSKPISVMTPRRTCW